MSRKRPLWGQELELLRAARDGRLQTNEHGRYIVLAPTGDATGTWRPDRKTRESLVRRGYLAGPTSDSLRPYRLTEVAEQALAQAVTP